MKNDKITKKDNYNYLRNMIEHMEFTDEADIKQRLLDFLDRELALLDMRSEKSKRYQKKHNAIEDQISNSMMNLFADETVGPLTINEICDKIKDVDITPQKVIYRVGKMVKEGTLSKNKISIKTDSGTRNIYTYFIQRGEE